MANMARAVAKNIISIVILLAISFFALKTNASDGKSSRAHALKLNEEGIVAIETGDLEKAERALKTARELDPYNLTIVYNLAGVYIVRNKKPDAIKLLKEVLKQHSTDAKLWVRLGDAYFSNRQPSEALKAYEQAYRLDKDYRGLTKKLGALYAMSGDTKKAEAMLIEAAQQNPDDFDVLLSLSSVMLANKKFDKSIGVAKKALQLKVDPEAYMTLGSAHEAKGDYKEALIAFKKARAVSKESLSELDEKIKELESQQ